MVSKCRSGCVEDERSRSRSGLSAGCVVRRARAEELSPSHTHTDTGTRRHLPEARETGSSQEPSGLCQCHTTSSSCHAQDQRITVAFMRTDLRLLCRGVSSASALCQRSFFRHRQRKTLKDSATCIMPQARWKQFNKFKDLFRSQTIIENKTTAMLLDLLTLVLCRVPI